jgi:hypothetical protein
MIFWVEEGDKESLIRLPEKKNDTALDEFFQKLYSAAGVEDDRHLYLL